MPYSCVTPNPRNAHLCLINSACSGLASLALRQANNSWRTLFVFVCLACLLPACATEIKTEFLVSKSPIGKFGGTFRQTHFGKDPKTLNPWIANDATSSHYGNMLFEGLFRTDPDTDEVIPHIAKSYKLLNGGKKIIVEIRKGVFWIDGKELTADDVVYTWNTLIRDRVAISSLRDILLVDGKFPQVSKLNNYSVQFETEDVFAPFLKTIGIGVAPKHDIENYFKSKKAKTFEERQKAFMDYLNVNTEPSKIVSNGAFMLSRLKNGERIEFVRNPNYFIVDSKSKRLPYLDKIVYSYVQDKNADVFKFLADESYTLNVDPEKAALLKSLEKKYGFTLYDLGPSTGTMFMWFNMTPNMQEPKYSWFNNKNFRKAISYAIDRGNIVNNVYQGLGAPLFTPESLRSPFLNEKLSDGYQRDLDYAKELLSQEGFKYTPGAGSKNLSLLDSGGNKVSFDLFTNASNKERELMGTIIADNLKELGIQVNFKVLEFNNFVSRISAGKSYEAGLIGFTGGNEPNSGANVWKSDGRLHIFDPRNLEEPDVKSKTRNWETEIDKLFLDGVRTMDFKKRKAIYDRFQEIVYEEFPMIYLASAKVLIAAKDNLGNIRKTKYSGIIPELHSLYLKSN